MNFVSVARQGQEKELDAGLGYVAWTKRVVEEASLDGELVFVGYGVVAPEYEWEQSADECPYAKWIRIVALPSPALGVGGTSPQCASRSFSETMPKA